MPLNTLFSKLEQREALSPQEAETAIESIMSGAETDDAIEHFLLLMREKGETVDELCAAVGVLRRHGVKLSKRYPRVLDTCGTGGDAKGTFNVSTLAALTAATLGATVAKHGNRAVSGFFGSADLLESLGIRTDLTKDRVEESIQKFNFAFFFAPHFHPAMKYAMPARRRIKGKTLFNLLGPLSNPAEAEFQLVGVYEAALVEKVANVLLRLGTRRAVVVHGLEGLDELSLSGPTRIAEVDGAVKVREVSPKDFGLDPVALARFQCANGTECKEAAFAVLRGRSSEGVDFVALNAAAGLYAAGKVGTIAEGLEPARKALQSGAVQQKIDAIAKWNQSLS